MERREGVLIALEGIDCAGKSHIIERLPGLLDDCRVPIKTTGERRSPLGDCLENDCLKEMSPLIKTLVFAADRAYIYDQVVRPLLEGGHIVVWDRYVASALVYRRIELEGRRNAEINMDYVEAVNGPFRPADLTIVVDIAAETSEARSRKGKRVEPYDPDFLAKVRSEYLSLVNGRDIIRVDGDRPQEEVASEIAGIIRSTFREHFS